MLFSLQKYWLGANYWEKLIRHQTTKLIQKPSPKDLIPQPPIFNSIMKFFDAQGTEVRRRGITEGLWPKVEMVANKNNNISSSEFIEIEFRSIEDTQKASFESEETDTSRNSSLEGSGTGSETGQDPSAKTGIRRGPWDLDLILQQYFQIILHKAGFLTNPGAKSRSCDLLMPY